MSVEKILRAEDQFYNNLIQNAEVNHPETSRFYAVRLTPRKYVWSLVSFDYESDERSDRPMGKRATTHLFWISQECRLMTKYYNMDEEKYIEGIFKEEK